MTASLDDYRWLVSPAAADALGEATASVAATGDKRPSLALVASLRKTLAAERAHLVAEQAELRARGAAKFPAAARMFFSPRALEQATDSWLAGYKARRFRPAMSVVDFCAGLGGDLIALAARGPSLGVDRDPVTTLLADANLAALGLAPPGSAIVAEAAAEMLSAADAWHIDPDRRPGGHRTSRPEFADPGLPTLEALRARCPHAAIKLAPAAEPPDAWRREGELEWISRQGECRQLVAWFGDLALTPGRRRATVLRGRGDAGTDRAAGVASGAANGAPPPIIAGSAAAGLLVRSLVGSGDERLPIADQIGAFLFEPDAAVLAAGLQGALAAEHQLAAIAPGVAYWTGDRPLSDAALSGFAVLEVLPYNPRRVKTLLRERGIGRVEVKQRGAGLDPAEIDRQLRGAGDDVATLLLARLGKRIVAILARRQ